MSFWAGLSYKIKAIIVGMFLASCVCVSIAAVWKADAERARTEAAISAALEDERARVAEESLLRIGAMMAEEHDRRNEAQRTVEEDVAQ